jgi:hypothetical protein
MVVREVFNVIGVAVRAVETETIAPILVPRAAQLINESFGGAYPTNQTQPEWANAIFNTISIYPDAMGTIAFLILAIMPFAMMWISNGNMKMAGIVGLITGGFVLAFLPAGYQAGAILCMVISAVSTLWGLYKQ